MKDCKLEFEVGYDEEGQQFSNLTCKAHDVEEEKHLFEMAGEFYKQCHEDAQERWKIIDMEVHPKE